MSYKLFLTQVGASKIATAATNGGSLKIKDFVVGDGSTESVPTRISSHTLISQRYRGHVTSIVPIPDKPNQYEITCVVPYDIGGFTISEFGLIDDTDALVWSGDLPLVQKPAANLATAVDYRIKAVIQIDNPDVTIIIDANLYDATQSWVQKNFIPRTALDLMFPMGYKYWSHNQTSPKILFDALFGYETYWRRLEGVYLLAVKDSDPNINQPMFYIGEQGDINPNNNRPDHYEGYTSYLWERYDPATQVIRYNGNFKHDNSINY